MFNYQLQSQVSKVWVDNLCKDNNICRSHGIEHALDVASDVANALKVDSNLLFNLDRQRLVEEVCEGSLELYNFLIELAGLGHDLDDLKFFPHHTNYENLRALCKLNNLSVPQTELCVKMVSWVSCSKNGNNVPEEITLPECSGKFLTFDVKNLPELLYPRYVDRLKAVGWIGLYRAAKYSKTTKAPNYLPSTLRANHFYDKLLRVSFFKTENSYLQKMKEQSLQPLIDLCLDFGQKGYLDNKWIEQACQKTGMTL
jgi:hypothetical protein